PRGSTAEPSSVFWRPYASVERLVLPGLGSKQQGLAICRILYAIGEDRGDCGPFIEHPHDVLRERRSEVHLERCGNNALCKLFSHLIESFEVADVYPQPRAAAGEEGRQTLAEHLVQRSRRNIFGLDSSGPHLPPKIIGRIHHHLLCSEGDAALKDGEEHEEEERCKECEFQRGNTLAIMRKRGQLRPEAGRRQVERRTQPLHAAPK